MIQTSYFAPQERFARTLCLQLDSQIGAGAALTVRLMDSLQQMAHLNLNVAYSSLQQINLAIRQLFVAQDAPQFLSLAASQVPPYASRAFDYAYYLTGIGSSTQSELTRIVGAGIAEANRRLIETVGNMDEMAARSQGKPAWRFARGRTPARSACR